MLEITDSPDSPDVKQWSEFVYGHPYGNIFQTPEMAEVYRRTKNYEPIALFGMDRNGEIDAILLGVIRTERSGLLKSLTSWSMVIGGPLFNDSNICKDILRNYDQRANKKAVYNEIRMLNNIDILDNILTSQGYFFEDHYNALVRIDKPKEQLWKQLKEDKRKGVKKARKLGIVIVEGTEKADLEIFYNLLRETYNRVRMPLPHISFYEAIFEILAKQGKAKFLFAKHRDEYIATQLALIYKNTIYALVTGAITEYLRYHPGDLLIWHLLEWGSENDFKVFDFGGGGTPTKNQNIRYYKSRFGAVFPNYGRYKKVYSPIKMKIAEKGFSIYRKLFIR